MSEDLEGGRSRKRPWRRKGLGVLAKWKGDQCVWSTEPGVGRKRSVKNEARAGLYMAMVSGLDFVPLAMGSTQSTGSSQVT